MSYSILDSYKNNPLKKVEPKVAEAPANNVQGNKAAGGKVNPTSFDNMTEAMKLDKGPNEIKRSKTYKNSELKKESESFTL